MLFSKRNGFQTAAKAIQRESIDDELRAGLWSVFFELFLRKFRGHDAYGNPGGPMIRGSNHELFYGALWFQFFKKPTDTIPSDVNDAVRMLRTLFLEDAWYRVFDFLEFSLANIDSPVRDKLEAGWNGLLERESSAYRLVGSQVAEITSEEELASIDTAITSSTPGAERHLRAALGKLTDRKSPDYRNSIKESISAVESICRSLTGDAGATLGSALNALQPKLSLHGALKAALSSLYGYTSDEHGIRHAMLEAPSLGFPEAKFMLVACSAFTNFLIAKSASAGMKKI